jgi:hypothetical protein
MTSIILLLFTKCLQDEEYVVHAGEVFCRLPVDDKKTSALIQYVTIFSVFRNGFLNIYIDEVSEH